jgi:hypothetical protein
LRGENFFPIAEGIPAAAKHNSGKGWDPQCLELTRRPTMRIPLIMFSAASIVALGGIAWADDHLFQAVDSDGLTLDSQPFQENGAGKIPDDAPGQGSPFTSFSGEEEDMKTPATATQAAVDHANVKPREPK